MVSSSDAFEKFETWRKDKTPLRVIVIVGGKIEDVLLGRIGAIDPDASLVGIAIDATRTMPRFDVEDSGFSVEPSRVVATRNESNWIVFEESLI